MPEDAYSARRRAFRRIFPQRADEDDSSWEARVGLYSSTAVPEIPRTQTITEQRAELARRESICREALAKAEEAKHHRYFSGYTRSTHQRSGPSCTLPNVHLQRSEVSIPVVLEPFSRHLRIHARESVSDYISRLEYHRLRATAQWERDSKSRS